MSLYRIFTYSILSVAVIVQAACASNEEPGGGSSNPGAAGQTSAGASGSGGGTSTGGTSTGGLSNAGSHTGGSSPGGGTAGSSATGGVGGTSGVGSKPTLSITLDDLEAHALAANPTTFGWSKGDLVAISDAEAKSGTKSILFLDGDELEAPEIQATYAAAARGVVKVSMFVVPQAVTARDAYITVYSDSASSMFRLADFRFRGDGSIDWRLSAAGEWMDLTLAFTPQTWVDVEIAWDSTSGGGNGQVWLTVGGMTDGPRDLYLPGSSTVFGIKFGATTGVDAAASLFVDDVGYAVE